MDLRWVIVEGWRGVVCEMKVIFGGANLFFRCVAF